MDGAARRAQIERGYTLGHGGKLDEGVAAYRKAEQLARTHPASAASLGAARHGIGWTQVEMGDLDAAGDLRAVARGRAR